MKRRVLFIKCRGGVIEEALQATDIPLPPSKGKLDIPLPPSKGELDIPLLPSKGEWGFLPGVIRNLYFIRKNLDFEFVMIINQDGEGTQGYPVDGFDRVQRKILEIFAGEGITFDNILSYNYLADTPTITCKQETALFKTYLAGDYDLENSYLIGDSEMDMQLAGNIGCKGICLKAGNDSDMISWDQIKELLFAGERQASVQRTTNETDIFIRINLDGNGICDIATGIGFFDHLLEQIGKHGGLDLTINVKGDLYVDEHHTVEDTAIALGDAIFQALGNKRGIERYGYCLPMDDCLCSVALDFGGRPWLVWDAQFKREKIGEMPTELFSHFFKSFSDAAKMNLHIKAEGENEHHKAEGIFKTLAKSIKMAVKRDVYKYNLPTTKGKL